MRELGIALSPTRGPCRRPERADLLAELLEGVHFMPVTLESPTSIEELLEQAEQLHTPPEVARSLLVLTRDDNFSVQQVAECMASDPAMSARLLRVVNSSQYGLALKVSNLCQAITLLGARSVRLLALSFAIVDQFTTGTPRAWYYRYWRHALTTALVASRIAARFSEVDRQDAYTAGLLADVGIPVMALARPHAYPELTGEPMAGHCLAAAERERFGFDHAAVSAQLLQRWSFPQNVIAAVRSHHATGDAEDHLARAVRGGSLMAEFLWNPQSGNREVIRLYFAAMGCHVDEFSELALATRDDVEREAQDFGFHIGCSETSQALRDRAQQQCFKAMFDTALTLDSVESLVTLPAAL